MTLFNAEILSIQNDVQYHESQLAEAKERLSHIEAAQEYSSTVCGAIEDCIQNIDPFYLPILQEHINQMFSDNSKSDQFVLNQTDNSKSNQVGLEQLDRQEVKEETPQEIIEEKPLTKEVEKTEEKEEVQTPNIERIDGSLVYSHADSICYVAGKSKGRLDNYGSYLTRILDIGDKYTVSKEPSFFETKYELRVEGISFDDSFHLQDFNLLKEWDHSVNEEARELWRETRLRKYETSKPRPKAIAIEDVKFGAIVSTSADDINKKQYKVLSHKELNGEQHLEVICIFNKEMPALVNICSWLKEVYPVELGNIKVDPRFNPTNFQKEEEVLMEDVAIYVPKETVKKSKGLTEKDFPAAPYKPIPLAEIEVCDIVSTGEHVTTYYEVTQNLGNCIKARCLYSRAFPKRVGEEYTLNTVYLVEKAFDMDVAV